MVPCVSITTEMLLSVKFVYTLCVWKSENIFLLALKMYKSLLAHISWFSYTLFSYLTPLPILSPHTSMYDIPSRSRFLIRFFFGTTISILLLLLRNFDHIYCIMYRPVLFWIIKEKKCYYPAQVVFLSLYLETKNLLPLHVSCGNISYGIIF